MSQRALRTAAVFILGVWASISAPLARAWVQTDVTRHWASLQLSFNIEPTAFQPGSWEQGQIVKRVPNRDANISGLIP